MALDADYIYAMALQKRLQDEGGDGDIEELEFKPPAPSKQPLPRIKRSNPHSNLDEDFLNRTQNLVHPQWETLDPTPDIQSLFGAFNMKFFQKRLHCVTLEWSKRMYSCAGICYSRSNRFGMDVTIRLSEPLLKLRPRKDLVETLLHEMIHAYCFVLNIREGNGGHGPNFKKIMFAINKTAGTNITVYHTFHDEVEIYKQHWWRCNGSCQHRSPFFGYVKRTSNRAPGHNDQWWQAHLNSCGGTFMKIKGPDPKPKKSAGKAPTAKPAAGADLRKFFHTPNGKPTESKTPSNFQNGGFKGPIKINGGGTMLLNPKTKPPTSMTSRSGATKPPSALPPIAAAFPPSSYPGLSTDPFSSSIPKRPSSAIVPAGGNLRNVKGFRDLNSGGDSDSESGGGGNHGRAVSGFKTTAANSTMSGPGYALDSGGSKYTRNTTSGRGNDGSSGGGDDGHVNRNHLRDIWSKRFSSSAGNSSSNSSDGKGGLGSSKILKPTSQSADATPLTGNSKRRRLSTDTSSNSIFIADEIEDRKKAGNWLVYDDDVMLKEPTVEIIPILSDDDDDFDAVPPTRPAKTKPMTSDERQNAIKREILDETLDLRDEDIQLIDDDYDDDADLSAASELADTSVIDEFFGEDTLLRDFTRENDVKPSSSRYVPNPDQDIITCPICQDKLQRGRFSDHLNGCTGIAITVKPRTQAMKKLASTSREVKTTSRHSSRPSVASVKNAKDILRDAGYSEQVLADIASASSSEENSFSSFTNSPPRADVSTVIDVNDSSPDEDRNGIRFRQKNLYKTTRQCPVCAREIEESEMNEHLDECLNK